MPATSTSDPNPSRAARRAQLLFDRDCAAARRQSLRIGLRPPRSLPLPEHIRRRRLQTAA